MINSPAEEKAPALTIYDRLLPPWLHKKEIFWVSFAVGMIVLLINFFLLPHWYKSTASLLPETEKSKLGSLSQFAGIAQLAGVNVSGGDLAKLYPTIVESETVLRSVIERSYQTEKFPQPVNLIQYFELKEQTPEKDFDAALKIVRDLLVTTFDTKTSLVTLSLEMREPGLAAEVLNAVIEELDSFMRSKRITNASEQARWISARLEEVSGELAHAEEALKTYKERNRRVMDSPELLLQQERLIREVTVKSTIFVELKKQYELAKIEEIKNISIVNVLDKARAAVRKERPKRATNAAIAFVLSFIATSLYYSFWPVYGNQIIGVWNMFRHARK